MLKDNVEKDPLEDSQSAFTITRQLELRPAKLAIIR
jgi:hypothetical protein